MTDRPPTANEKLTVKVYPYRKGVCYGNIIWRDKYPMRNGRFPKDHPVGGECGYTGQMGKSDGMDAFRARGYWASCFPEGDGITFEPLKGQPPERWLADIRECFGWDARWARGVQV